jgi:hypothetical protein
VLAATIEAGEERVLSTTFESISTRPSSRKRQRPCHLARA